MAENCKELIKCSRQLLKLIMANWNLAEKQIYCYCICRTATCLSNKNGKTTVVFTLSSEDKDSNNGLGIDNIILKCNDQTYKAKHVDAKFGDTTTVVVKFKKVPQLENARLTFNVNGEEKYINIDKDLMN